MNNLQANRSPLVAVRREEDRQMAGGPDRFFDLAIVNGRLWRSEGGLCPERSFLGIRQGRIAAMGAMPDQAAAALPAREIIDAAGCLIMPGLVNCHNHAAMTLFRGLADDLPLMEWLTSHIFPAEARFVTPEMVYWCSKLAAAEMLLSGTTLVADAYFHEGMAAQAFVDAGMRAVAAQGVIDFPAPGVPDPANNVAVAVGFMEQWQGRDSLVSPAIFCHSPYTCGRDTLVAAKQAAVDKGGRFFLHLAEIADEVEESLERTGKTPVGYLRELGLLDAQTVCVHGVWLTPADMDILAVAGARLVSCPASNMKLASGIAPLPELLEHDVPVGLGTDGCASNNRLDLFREMELCAKLHKVNRGDPTVLPAASLLRMATADGASCLGMAGKVGELAVGMRADLLTIDLQQPNLTPFYGLDTLVYAGNGAQVRDVLVDGRVVVRARRIVSFDLEETKIRVRELAAGVRKRA